MYVVRAYRRRPSLMTLRPPYSIYEVRTGLGRLVGSRLQAALALTDFLRQIALQLQRYMVRIPILYHNPYRAIPLCTPLWLLHRRADIHQG